MSWQPPYYEVPGRRTGRTTNMLVHAIKLAATTNVVILCRHTHKPILESQLRRLLRVLDVMYLGSKIKIATAEELKNDLDEQRLRLRSGVDLLVDHSYIEQNYRELIDHLHAFDSPKELK